MKDIVITGRGLITPLGNGLAENEEALRAGKSGFSFRPEWAEVGLESQVGGVSDEDPECPLLDKKRKRFTTANSKMAVAAAYEALLEAKLDPESLKNKRIALIMGCAASVYQEIFDLSNKFLENRKVKRVSPFVVPRVMPSSAVANLSLILGITGENYDISSACTSSAHAIMLSTRLLDAGLYDIVITGGSEEISWVYALGFDAMRALSRKYNETPLIASRPFDRDRDGFVLSEGAGVVVLETMRHANTRGVEPKAYISGIGTNSNATDMVVPSAHYSAEVMKLAIEDSGLKLNDIEFINAHGTATIIGDPVELEAIKLLFKDHAEKIAINSTKSMTGHMIGATGAVEAIFCSMMMDKEFIAPSANLDNPEPGFEWADFVRTTRENQKISHCLCNSFGFGGTNVSLVISHPEEI